MAALWKVIVQFYRLYFFKRSNFSYYLFKEFIDLHNIYLSFEFKFHCEYLKSLLANVVVYLID